MSYDFLKEAKERKSDFLRDLEELIAQPSLLDLENAKEGAPFGSALKNTLEHTLAMAEKDGFKTHNIDGYAGIIEFGEGDEIVGMLGHLDVVPVGEGWTTDPFTMIEKDGYIFGRGVRDDKGPTMAAYYAMKILRDLNVPLKRKIYLIVGCDEETGMRCMAYYKEHAPLPNFGFVPDATFPVVYGEKGILHLRYSLEMPTIVTKMALGERPNIVIGRAAATVSAGVEEDKFAAYLEKHHLTGEAIGKENTAEYHIVGEFAHAARPEKGVNAGWHMMNFIGETYQDAMCQKLAYLLAYTDGTNMNINNPGSHMGPLTMNLGILNISSTHCDFVIDIRYPNDTDADTIKKAIMDAFKAHDLTSKEEVLSSKVPLFVDPENHLVKTLESCYREFSGDYETPLQTMGGGTYARTLDNFVAFGTVFPTHERPDYIGDAHQADEGTLVDDLLTACAIYANALEKLTK